MSSSLHGSGSKCPVPGTESTQCQSRGGHEFEMNPPKIAATVGTRVVQCVRQRYLGVAIHRESGEQRQVFGDVGGVGRVHRHRNDGGLEARNKAQVEIGPWWKYQKRTLLWKGTFFL